MTHASLFSGIGGPEVAAAMLGWENVFHCEINDFGRAILEYHFPQSKSYIDVTQTDFTEWRGRVDVLTGGFPCQPFSYAGERRGAEDDRYLWPEFKRVIAEVRPPWVVGENVAGITTMVEPGKVTRMESEASLFGAEDTIHRYRYDQPFTIERVCRDLEELGYAVQPMLIPACAVGAPHRRDRVFIIAYSEDAMHLRCNEREYEERGRERDERNACAGDTERNGSEERAITSDTEKQRSERMRPKQSENCGNKQVKSGGGNSERNTERFLADTTDKRLERRDEPGCEESGERVYLWRYLTGHRDEGSEEVCGQRWANFPTVSPIHRGNDGLPFPVGHLTIPFSRWRTESLKAYGNAIVPQVMYEILRAIEIISQQ